jgi:exodeoxyribonuclease V alpha subunit
MSTNYRTFDSVRGVVDTIRSYNPANGFVIARLLLAGEAAEINLSGTLPGIRVGEWLRAQGIWTKHSQNGWHLVLKNYTLETPTGGADLEIYLTHLIPSIPPELAERIVQNCGADTLRIIEESPERLRDIPGLTAKKIREIRAGWSEQKAKNELRALLQHPTIKPELAIKLYNALNATSKQSSKKRAQLEQELFALDLAVALPIAAALGIDPKSPARADAAVRAALKQWTSEGHVFADRADLLKQCAELYSIPQTLVAPSLRRLSKQGDLVVESNRIYPKTLHDAETGVAARIRERAAQKSALAEFRANDWNKSFNWLAAHSRISLTPQQQVAVKTALTSRLSILTGGPGTGKTTTVRAVVDLLKKKGYTFQLAAPTGRAAKRMAQATGAPAQTIHRLLAFKPVKRNPKSHATTGSQATADTFAKTLDRPLSADFVIVDESSMLDLALTHDLLTSLGQKTQLLLVGDPNQLPSIGSGKVLQDLIDSQALPVVALDTIFRQQKESSIIANAHRIHAGKPPIFFEGADDFFIIEEQHAPRAAARVLDLVTNKIPINFGFDSLEDIQVLSPVHQGPAGVSALNEALQAALNPPDARNEEYPHRDRIFRVGDRVLQTRNNYSKGVFNGDRGRIAAFDKHARCMVVEFEEGRVEYDLNELDELAHAFALTVHKAQGSEYRAVVLVLPAQHKKILERNLLYTAVTRARELVVIVATQSTISAAIKNNRTPERRTWLAQRIAARQAKQDKHANNTARATKKAPRPHGRKRTKERKRK